MNFPLRIPRARLWRGLGRRRALPRRPRPGEGLRGDDDRRDRLPPRRALRVVAVGPRGRRAGRPRPRASSCARTARREELPSKKMIILHPGDQLWEYIAGRRRLRRSPRPRSRRGPGRRAGRQDLARRRARGVRRGAHAGRHGGGRGEDEGVAGRAARAERDASASTWRPAPIVASNRTWPGDLRFPRTDSDASRPDPHGIRQRRHHGPRSPNPAR